MSIKLKDTILDYIDKAYKDGSGNTISSTYLPLSGGTMKGSLATVGSKYGYKGEFGLNMNNSDIIGANAIYFGDTSNSNQEGLHFMRSNSNYDTLRAMDGVLMFATDISAESQPSSTTYNTVYHGGNTSTIKSDLGLGALAYKGSLSFSELTNKPTTISGYGITDAVNMPFTNTYYYDLNTLLSNNAVIVPYFQRVGVTSDVNNIGSARKGVIRLNGGGSESQLLFDHYSGVIYHRYYGASAFSGWRTILHSENYTDYTYSKSTIDAKLGGYLPLSGGTLSAWGNPLTIERTDGAGPAIGFLGVSGAIGAIGVDYNNEPYFYRSSNKTTYFLIHSGNIGSQSVASATKLATSRKLWGQSFNGENDVNGHLSIGTIMGQVTANRAELSIVSETDVPCDLWLGNSAGNVWSINCRASNENRSFSIYHGSLGYLFRIDGASGNVGIGTTSPQYKLDVVGTLNASGAVTLGSTLSVASNAQISGTLTLNGNQYDGNYALNLSNSNIINVNSILTADNAEGPGEGIQFKRNDGKYDSVWASSGVFYFSPAGTYGSSGTSYSTNHTVLHSGNYSSWAAPSSHTHSYLPLSGGTMTGGIAYAGSKGTYTMISFIDNAADNYGNGIMIGGGGATIVGGGEAAAAASGTLSNGGDEKLILCNDGNIDFYTNCQNGIASATHTYIDSSGNFSGGASRVNGLSFSAVTSLPSSPNSSTVYFVTG